MRKQKLFMSSRNLTLLNESNCAKALNLRTAHTSENVEAAHRWKGVGAGRVEEVHFEVLGAHAVHLSVEVLDRRRVRVVPRGLPLLPAAARAVAALAGPVVRCVARRCARSRSEGCVACAQRERAFSYEYNECVCQEIQ